MSDLFTSMCRGSRRLQEAWIGRGIKSGDRIAWFTDGKLDNIHILKGDVDCFLDLDGDEQIWLPRQEDLQELYESNTERKDRFGGPHDLFVFLNKLFPYDHVHEFVDFYPLQDFYSILWLLFVHKELWNQSWNFKEERWEG